MTEHLPPMDNYKNEFIGKHVDIHLSDDTSLLKLLQSTERTQTYLDIHDPDKLPYPAHLVQLESWHEKAANSLRIQGEISFDPTALESTFNTWPNEFLNTIAEAVQSYSYEPAYMSHDSTAIYVSLDRTTTIRLALSSSATECSIDVDLLPTEDIEDATHESLPEPYADRTLSPVEQLRHVTSMLGLSIDALRDYYGKPPKHFKRYELEQFKLPKNLKALATAALTEPPEIEMLGVTTDIDAGLDTIGGATQAKQRLSELADIMRNPDMAAKFDIHRNHFLLYGPPGTGKTSLVKAFSYEIDATLVSIKSSDIVDIYVGSAGKNFTKIFEEIKNNPERQVVFFDEFDSLAQKFGSGSGEQERSAVRKLLNTELEDIAKNYPNIIVTAATNADIDDLEPSLVRPGRFEPIGVQLPNEQERYDILNIILFKSLQRTLQQDDLLFDNEGFYLPTDGFSLYDQAINTRELARISDGMTGATFEVVFERARKKLFSHAQTTGELLPVTHQDLVREITQFGR